MRIEENFFFQVWGKLWGRLSAEMDSGEINLLSGKSERGGHVTWHLGISLKAKTCISKV